MGTSAGPWGVDISDIDGDGDPDIIVANRNETKINVFRQDAALSFTRLDITTSKPSRNLRVGDYDGDGKPDIAFTSFSGLQFSVDVLRNANCVSPKILNAGPLTICTPQTIRLETTPAPGVTFDWSKDGAAPFQSGPNEYADITNTAGAGSYTVTATGEGGACVITSPAIVVGLNAAAPPANPTITSNAPLCIDGSLQLSTALAGGATYQWTGPNGFSSAAQNPLINNVTVNNAGLYFLRLLDPVSLCSSNKISSQVDVASLPVFTVSSSSPGAACQGSTVTLTVNSASGYTYQWLKNSTNISGETGVSLAVPGEGDYSVIVTSSSPTCNQETSKTTVVLLSVPVAGFQSPAAACTGTAVNFTDQTVFDLRGTAKFAWNFGDGNNSTVQNPPHTYLNPGNLNVSLTASYEGVTGCTSVVSKPITVNTKVVPVITSSANPICAGDSTTLSVAGSFSSFSWTGGGSGNSIGITEPGPYTVNTVDQNNCASSATLTINSKPAFSLTVSADTTVNQGDQAHLTATGADAYSWTPAASLDNPGIANPIAKPTTTTTYHVVGVKAGFCDAQDSIKVTVNIGGTAAIKPPLIFSPNGDIINDTWLIQGVENYADCTMKIYDGHGSKVYEVKGYNNSNSWDGTFNGKSVPDGTYYYVFFGCPNLPPATGNVSATGYVLVVR